MPTNLAAALHMPWMLAPACVCTCAYFTQPDQLLCLLLTCILSHTAFSELRWSLVCTDGAAPSKARNSVERSGSTCRLVQGAIAEVVDAAREHQAGPVATGDRPPPQHEADCDVHDLRPLSGLRYSRGSAECNVSGYGGPYIGCDDGLQQQS